MTGPEHMEHQTLEIKVNASVDIRIAPLIIALNRIKGIYTIDSCQGDANESAYVYFKYGSSPKELAIFCVVLAEKLNLSIQGSNDYSLRLEWNYDFSTNMAVLMTSQKNIHKLAKAIDSFAINRHKIFSDDS